MVLAVKKHATASADHVEEKGMTKVIVNTEEAPKTAGYSQMVKAGGLIFVAGQGPFDATTGGVVGTTIQEQTAQCLKSIAAILHAAGGSLEQAVNATCNLAEESVFAGMNEEWGKWYPQGPTRTPGRETAHSSTGHEDFSCP